MAEKINKTEASRVIRTHRYLLSELRKAENLNEKLIENIQSSVDRIVEEKTMEILKTIPTEEINRGGKGFRIKPLIESGYKTFEDIYNNEDYIYNIKGVGEKSYVGIMREVNSAVRNTKKKVRIKLSNDDKTPATTSLIMDIYKYVKVESQLAESRVLSNKYRDIIEERMEQLSVGTSFFRWLFSTKEKREKALNAYEKLYKMLDSSYTETIDEIVEKINNLDSINMNEAWNNFLNNPTLFFQVLDNVKPGLLMKKGKVGGVKISGNKNTCKKESKNMITHFGLRIKDKESNHINREIYLSAKPEHMRGWTEEHYPRQILKAGLNYDLNMEFFERLNKEDFNTHLNTIIKKYKMKECIDLNEYDNVSGIYMIVLDEFKQVYIGQSEDIKRRIKEHWNSKKSLERLIYGDICSSVLSIDSFGSLDTTRIFCITRGYSLHKIEEQIVADLDVIYSLNRVAGGIGSADTYTGTKATAVIAALATKRKKDLAPLVDIEELQNILTESGFRYYLEKYQAIRDKYFELNPTESIESLGLRVWDKA